MAILIALLGIFGAIAVHVVASELYHQIPQWALSLIKAAVRALPKDEQPRYLEEWTAHLEEQASALAKMRHAIECWLGVRAFSKVLTQEISITVTQGGSEREIGRVRVSRATAAFVFQTFDELKRSKLTKSDFTRALAELKTRHRPLGEPKPSELREVADLLLRASGRVDAQSK